jgi:hypothetical protein
LKIYIGYMQMAFFGSLVGYGTTTSSCEDRPPSLPWWGGVVFMTHSQRMAENRELTAQLTRIESRFEALESIHSAQKLKRSPSSTDLQNIPASETTRTEQDGQQFTHNDELLHQDTAMRRVLAARRLIPPDQASIDSGKGHILDPPRLFSG